MVLPVVAVVILMLTAAVKGDDSGQQGERHEEVKNIEAVSSCTQNANMLTRAAEKPEPDEEFEEWVKPHIEGMVTCAVISSSFRNSSFISGLVGL